MSAHHAQLRLERTRLLRKAERHMVLCATWRGPKDAPYYQLHWSCASRLLNSARLLTEKLHWYQTVLKAAQKSSAASNCAPLMASSRETSRANR